MSTPIEEPGQCGGCGSVTLKLGTASEASPVNGTIDRWRLKGASEVEDYELNVLRRNAGNTFTVTASSGSVTPKGSEVETLTTSLPIAVGEFIELNVPAGGEIALLETPATESYFETGLNLGETRAPEEGEHGMTEFTQAFALGFNADVEATPPMIIPPVVVSPIPAPAVKHCVVPKLIGKKLKAAKKKIHAADCKLGHVAKKKGVTAKTGKVVKQSPKAGVKKPAGSKVSLKLG
jgi:hypothetical protein